MASIVRNVTDRLPAVREIVRLNEELEQRVARWIIQLNSFNDEGNRRSSRLEKKLPELLTFV